MTIILIPLDLCPNRCKESPGNDHSINPLELFPIRYQGSPGYEHSINPFKFVSNQVSVESWV